MSGAGAPTAPRPWSLRGRLGRAFIALTVLIIALSGVFAGSSIRFALKGNAVINTWQPATAAGQRILADAVNQESGLRGYLLERRPAALAPYDEYLKAQRTDVDRVRGLIGHDADLVRGLARLQRQIETWRAEVAAPQIAAVRAGRSPAPSLGIGTFNRIRTDAAALTAALRARSAAARGARTHAGALAVVALVAGMLLILAAAALLWRGLGRWVLGPVDRLATQARQVVSGQLNHAIVADGPAELVGLGVDVDVMRAQIVDELARVEQSRAKLWRQGEVLARSNADLQQFAYVASHDLSEPLRKVANFCQLLERQYGDQLDERAEQYIAFAVDGAKRMQDLIQDLLELSRVGRTSDEFVAVDLDAVLDQVLETLSEKIGEAGAVVERTGPLPTVRGDRTLLTSLLINLVGNAVKYRRPDAVLTVEVGAEAHGPPATWLFTVRDNGIGIDAKYGERIFAIFQRLHLRDAYEGTGIGLALCRRIVEFHEGRIWLDTMQSTPGSTFRFTLPEGGPVAGPD